MPCHDCETSDKPSLQSESVKHFILQILEFDNDAKIQHYKKSNTTTIINIKIDEPTLKKLVFNLKLKMDVELIHASFGMYDDKNEFKNFPRNANNIISTIICNNFTSKIKQHKLANLNKLSDSNEYVSLNVGDVFDTSKMDDINDILGNKSSKHKVKYLSGITFKSKDNSNQPVGQMMGSSVNCTQHTFSSKTQECYGY